MKLVMDYHWLAHFFVVNPTVFPTWPLRQRLNYSLPMVPSVFLWYLDNYYMQHCSYFVSIDVIFDKMLYLIKICLLFFKWRMNVVWSKKKKPKQNKLKHDLLLLFFSFGAKLDFVFRYGQIVSVDKNENKNPPDVFIPLIKHVCKYLLV